MSTTVHMKKTHVFYYESEKQNVPLEDVDTSDFLAIFQIVFQVVQSGLLERES